MEGENDKENNKKDTKVPEGGVAATAKDVASKLMAIVKHDSVEATASVKPFPSISAVKQ